MPPQSGQVVSFEAFRREREGRRARVLPYLVPASTTPRSPFHGITLSEREVEHRQLMLRHLTGEGERHLHEVPHGQSG